MLCVKKIVNIKLLENSPKKARALFGLKLDGDTELARAVDVVMT